jgi:hypothetical protein
MFEGRTEKRVPITTSKAFADGKGTRRGQDKKPDQMARVAHQADRLAKILENALKALYRR